MAAATEQSSAAYNSRHSRVGTTGPAAKPLKDVQTDMIREAVNQARGNVAEAARALGISRATVYRKLGRRDRHDPSTGR